MRAAVEEVEDEGNIELTPICMVHMEFQIDEDNNCCKVPAQNALCCLNIDGNEYDAMSREPTKDVS